MLKTVWLSGSTSDLRTCVFYLPIIQMMIIIMLMQLMMPSMVVPLLIRMLINNTNESSSNKSGRWYDFSSSVCIVNLWLIWSLPLPMMSMSMSMSMPLMMMMMMMIQLILIQVAMMAILIDFIGIVFELLLCYVLLCQPIQTGRWEE